MQVFEQAPAIADAKACTASIKKGSLSFSLASMLLSLKHRSAIHALYSWCRWCDNTIDDIPKSESNDRKNLAIARLRQDTDAALSGTYNEDNFVFRSLQMMTATYKIPRRYFHDLIDGMEMDVDKHRYDNADELRLYCYRVAGVVGLMFSHIVGLRDQTALKYAVDLGIAMQLTNIARDINEDFHMGRVYLPQNWLKSAGITTDNLIASDTKLWPVVERLLLEANQYYQSGDAGVKELPWKAALAAKAARNIYAEIGRKILATGPSYIKRRTVVSGPQKCLLLLKTIMQLTAQIPFRISHPFRRCSMHQEWSFK
jgi:phytoene synthase